MFELNVVCFYIRIAPKPSQHPTLVPSPSQHAVKHWFPTELIDKVSPKPDPLGTVNGGAAGTVKDKGLGVGPPGAEAELSLWFPFKTHRVLSHSHSSHCYPSASGPLVSA